MVNGTIQAHGTTCMRRMHSLRVFLMYSARKTRQEIGLRKEQFDVVKTINVAEIHGCPTDFCRILQGVFSNGKMCGVNPA